MKSQLLTWNGEDVKVRSETAPALDHRQGSPRTDKLILGFDPMGCADYEEN
jgi:hypothetical protein